ncbi:MAG TPA: flippase activity-associated protein Agl23 [Candidatus Acidoferrum sp.]|nr:flippase activity-associated protein Agl23 [Candidatus Acidoferrum sp.]
MGTPGLRLLSGSTLILLLLVAALALGLRCFRLDQRPMHCDEAVKAVKFGEFWDDGGYRYDPSEHHGPSLYYATLAAMRLAGRRDIEHLTEAQLRLITVGFGLGLILLLPLVADGLGRSGTVWAAALTALSPAMVFYSRYYIHEMLLVFFTFLALAAGWRYWRSGKLGWALLAGAGVGLMDATKETFVLSLAAAALALAANWAWGRWADASRPPEQAARIPIKHMAAGLAVWLGVALLLFSSFFSNAAGPLDSLRTYLPWLHRAEGASPHIHSWGFYWHRLLWFHHAKGPVWSEGLILVLGVLGAYAGFARRGLGGANASFVRFLALYTFALAAAYTAIAYKTPWCLLGFWHGMILLAGVGSAGLIRRTRTRPLRMAVRLLILAGAAQLGWQAWQAAVTYAADPRNPYVYAQTSPDLLNLVQRVEALAKVSPQDGKLVVKVMAPDSDYWPLPWYLRNLERVGYYAEVPADPYASIMIVSSQFKAALDEKKTHVMVGYFQLRPQVFLELYVELGLWKEYLESSKHERPGS